MAGFGDSLAAMDDAIEASLGDGCATYQGPDHGAVLVRGIEIMLDENLQQNGPDGMVLTNAMGITWRRGRLRDVERGGFFAFGQRRFTVEVKIADDGVWVTVACTEVK